MKYKLFLMVMSVFLIGFTSAIIYPGETMVVEHNLTGRLFWNITENISELSVMPVITFNNTHLFIYIKPETPPNSFKINFMDEINETTNTVYINSGGGSHTITKVVNNTIVKEVPIYITNGTNNTECVNNQTIIKEVPVETNKIPPWLWILVIIETILLITLIIILAKKKSDDEIELKGGQKEDGK
jgi:hypothetical protein